MAGYFNFFPATQYANTIATNIISKVKFDQSVQNNLAIFYPYQIQQGERADQIAYKFYDDPTLDWVIYLANNIMDPYYDWPMSFEVFNEYIISKYTSITKAKQRISFFRNNYASDESLLSPSTYDSLSYLTKKYYTPVYGLDGTVISYKRQELDQVIETNKIVLVEFSSTSNTFIVGERVTSGSKVGFVTKENLSSTPKNIVIDKITGSFAVNDVVTGDDSGAVGTATSVTLLDQPLSDIDAVFFEPVSYFTYEEEINENKSNIRILDKSYISKIEKDMRELFL